MRIGIFSDMHGNAVGLQAVLDVLAQREVDSYICCGDAVQGGSEPARVVELLREIDCKVVMGNSDYFVLTGTAGEDSTEQISGPMQEIRQWTADRLGPDGLSYIESFPRTLEVALEDGWTLLCCHGSPRSFNEVLLPEMEPEELGPALAEVKASFVAGGHTHLQWFRCFPDLTFFNPGSAGAAYYRYMDEESFYFYPIAQWAILHSDPSGTTVEFGQVPFDVDLLEKAVAVSGRPHSQGEAARYRPR